MVVHDHDPGESEPEDPRLAARNARYGLVLFVLYGVIYAAYVLITALRPTWMDWMPLAGINLAVVYGFALIIGALAVALIYGWLCRQPLLETPRATPPVRSTSRKGGGR